MTVVGIDAHKDTLAAFAADDVGRAVAHRSFDNTPQGHAELAGWVPHHEAALVAMEGSGNYGRPAAVALAGAGTVVVEVPPNMTAAARRRQRTGTKTDPADALAIARVGFAEPTLPPPRPGGHIEELRGLVRYRCELSAQRTRQINRLHADLSQLRPGYHHRTGRLISIKALDAAARMLRGDHSASARIALSRITTLRGLRRDIASLPKTSTTPSKPPAPPCDSSTVPGTSQPPRSSPTSGTRHDSGPNQHSRWLTEPPPSRPAPDASDGTDSTEAVTAKSTKPSTQPPSPRLPDPTPKAAATTNAAAPAAKPNEKPSEPSNDASQTASGPTSTRTA